jgi:release factor glutamine methyltransferase
MTESRPIRAVDWVRSAADRLTVAGVPEPLLDAQVLAAHALGKDRSWLLAHPEAEIPASADRLLASRERREPLAYIVGWREFYSHRFDVGPGVLVPRQETETVVEACLDGMGGKVLDVGTGTGCIAVSIKLARPNWMVAACDVSRPAVTLARKNAEKLGATIHVTMCDMFEGFPDTDFGLIVSNPPYVREGTVLQPEVANEPPEALFAGPDGLAFYERLAAEAIGHLTPWGRIVVELGDGMAEPVSQVFLRNGWAVVETRPDWGGMPRALVLTPQKSVHRTASAP